MIKYLLLFIFNLSIYGQKVIIGKSYKAQIAASCKQYNDGGGCMIYDYCTLTFNKTEVIVNFSSEEYCTPNNVVNKKSINEKHYSYRIKNNTIIIKNFNEYGNLYYKGNKLIGKKEMNYKEFVPLIFNKIE